MVGVGPVVHRRFIVAEEEDEAGAYVMAEALTAGGVGCC